MATHGYVPEFHSERLSEFRQLLPRAIDIGPGILSQSGHPLDKVLNGILACALETVQLGPIDRDRYRRPGARAGRVRGYGGCFAAIPQIVDENALVPFCLCS